MNQKTALRVALALERIADRLDMVILEPTPAPIPEPTECPHPEDQRIDFGMTQGMPDWQCQICGARSPTS